MALSQGNKAEWADIRALFDRANAERHRWGVKVHVAPGGGADTSITLTELTNLHNALSELSSRVSAVRTAASTSGVTAPRRGDLISADYPDALSRIIRRVEDTAGVRRAFQFEGGHTVARFAGGHKIFTFDGGHTTFNFAGGHTIFTFDGGHRTFNFSGGHFGGASFSSHKDTTCRTFAFFISGNNSQRNGSPDAGNNPFCHPGTFTNGCSAPHQGTTVFDFAGGHTSVRDNSHRGSVVNNSHTSVRDSSYKGAVRNNSHEGSATSFGNSFNSHFTTGFCSSFNGATHFNRL